MQVLCFILELGLVRMAYVTLFDILIENIEKTVLRGLSAREMSFPKFNLKFGGRDCLGNNPSLIQTPLISWVFSDFSAYDLGIIEVRLTNFSFQAYITKSSKAETIFA